MFICPQIAFCGILKGFGAIWIFANVDIKCLSKNALIPRKYIYRQRIKKHNAGDNAGYNAGNNASVGAIYLFFWDVEKEGEARHNRWF